MFTIIRNWKSIGKLIYNVSVITQPRGRELESEKKPGYKSRVQKIANGTVETGGKLSSYSHNRILSSKVMQRRFEPL